MLAAEGKDVSIDLPEEACDIGTPLAKAVCLSSADGLEMGSVQWVWNGVKAVGPRVKAARRKAPKVNLGRLLARAEKAGPLDEVDACDTTDETMARAACMSTYDPLSSSSAGWVWSGIKAIGPRIKSARVKSRVKLPMVVGAAADDVDACDMSDDVASRARCLQSNDPFSSGSANWVLNHLFTKDDDWVGTTTSKTPLPENAGGWSWNIWRTTAKVSPAAMDL
jgi:hypothetical protein